VILAVHAALFARDSGLGSKWRGRSTRRQVEEVPERAKVALGAAIASAWFPQWLRACQGRLRAFIESPVPAKPSGPIAAAFILPEYPFSWRAASAPFFTARRAMVRPQ
jgi:hypothetical protein